MRNVSAIGVVLFVVLGSSARVAAEGLSAPGDSSFQVWRRNPDAAKKGRARQSEREAEVQERQEGRGRDWLGPDAPTDISRKDANRVHRGGIFLATGIPAVLAGTLALSLTSGSGCGSGGRRAAGVAFTFLGAGLSVGGIVALVRAPRRARRAPKSEKHRGHMVGAAIGSTVLSGTIVGTAGLSGTIACD